MGLNAPIQIEWVLFYFPFLNNRTLKEVWSDLLERLTFRLKMEEFK